MKMQRNEKIIKIFMPIVLMVALILGCMGNKNATEIYENAKSVEQSISVEYNSHIQNIGWEQDFSKKDGELSGTQGQGLRLEAMKINVNNSSNIKIKYQTHVQNIGWQDWKYNGDMAGTQGQGLRLEGIKIELENTTEYSVMYRVHVQNIGWQSWKYDGEMAGTEGRSLRLEAIEIKIISKEPRVDYRTHVEGIGWQETKSNGEMAGTSGQSKRLEAITINMRNLPQGVNFQYRVHVQDIGWQNWKTNGEMAGTSGQSKRLEAIKIKLEGTSEYSIMYRVHVEGIGWQEWCYDGETAGTEGCSKRLEAIEIKIVPKINEIKVNMEINEKLTQVSNRVEKISGWIMKNFLNEEIKIFIDNQEIPIQTMERTEDITVLNTKKGYGDENIYNPKPRFELTVDFSQCTLGAHSLLIRVSKDGQILKEISKNINITEKITSEIGTYGVSGLKAIGDVRGSDLNYYKYGSGPNVFFAVFAVHGFEDIWERDGQELVTIADNFHQRLLDCNDYNLAEKWTIYILPGVNKDGLNYGYTNNGPGRTTLFSQAPNNQGIDLNRCWQTESTYKIYTDARNYNGNKGFQAFESQYLRDFLLSHKSINGQTVLVDLHGWTQQLIGNAEVCKYYANQFPENDTSAVGRYGTGYLVNWARLNLGSNTSAAKTALIELPNSGITGHQSVINSNLSNRYIDATLEMLKNM